MTLFRKIILISWLCFMLLESPKWIKTTEVSPTTPQDTKNAIEGVVEVAEAKDVAQGDVFQVYFGKDADKWRKLAFCESSNDPTKINKNKNGTFDYGLTQINSLWLKVYNVTPEQLLIPDINLKIAKQIYQRTNDFSAWRFSKKCHGLD